MECLVSYHANGTCRVSLEEIERRARKMLAAYCLTRATLSVVLCDDAMIRRLNRQYRGQNRPTDVLSFSMLDGESIVGQSHILGDIVISLPTAARQATARTVTLLDEVTELMAHGLLHLIGFDHRTAFERRRMSLHTRALINAI